MAFKLHLAKPMNPEMNIGLSIGKTQPGIGRKLLGLGIIFRICKLASAVGLLVVLILVLAGSKVRGAEGFFEPGQIQTDFDQREYAKSIFQLNHSNSAGGTIFFVSADGVLITAQHVLQRYIDRYEREQGQSIYQAIQDGGPQELQLAEGQKIELMNSMTNERLEFDRIKIISISRPSSRFVTRDFVVAQIAFRPQNFLKKFATKMPSKFDSVISMGYPQYSSRNYGGVIKTPLGEYRDSDGQSLRVTVGQILTRPTMLGLRFNSMATSADGLPGMSGAPVFAKSGELVGVTYGGDGSEKDHSIHHMIYKEDVNTKFQSIEYIIKTTNLYEIIRGKIRTCSRAHLRQ